MPKPLDFSKYNNIKNRIREIYTDEKNSLPYSRQYAIDNSFGDYFIICDCDDLLYSPITIYIYMKYIKNNDNIDIMVFSKLKEFDFMSNRKWCIVEPDLIESWAKLYNRKFIVENNIKFDTKLQFNEDRDYNIQIYNYWNDDRCFFVSDFEPTYIYFDS